jgi:hypothetical protein
MLFIASEDGFFRNCGYKASFELCRNDYKDCAASLSTSHVTLSRIGHIA